MNLHEYQAKNLLKQYGIPVPLGEIVRDPETATAAAARLGGNRWVVKAQVHAGGRGKAGGVKVVDNKDAVEAAVKALLGKRLVTYQTDAHGQPVNQILIEQPADIVKELYLGAIIDRASQRIVIMASTEGGVEIEKIAKEQPEKILTAVVEPQIGLQPYQCRQIFYGLKLKENLLPAFTDILLKLYKLFVERDLSLLEINPLVITAQDQIVCLDGKINVDENALYRQPEIREMRDPTQEDERENRAQQWNLNYIALEGDIGCMVNGAGLAMATMDIIKLYGGNPANFLDVGGSATAERVKEAFKIIISDKNVKGILVNIFGGIVRCDLIADGIISAVSEVGIAVPVVVRLQGNNADLGAKKLLESGLNIVGTQNFSEAAQKIVDLVYKRGKSA